MNSTSKISGLRLLLMVTFAALTAPAIAIASTILEGRVTLIETTFELCRYQRDVILLGGHRCRRPRPLAVGLRSGAESGIGGQGRFQMLQYSQPGHTVALRAIFVGQAGVADSYLRPAVLLLEFDGDNRFGTASSLFVRPRHTRGVDLGLAHDRQLCSALAPWSLSGPFGAPQASILFESLASRQPDCSR